MEEKSSKFASKGYVYRKLKELPFTSAMNRRKFSSLLEETLQSINSSKAFVQGRKLSQLSPQQLFNFPKLGFRTRESLTTGKKTFNNVITTDGYSVSFLFTRLVKRSIALKSNPTDFVSDIRNGCTVWGVDPGIIDLITTVDSSEDKERQRTTSLDEYYHLCGYNRATFQRHKHQSQNESVFQLISQLPSLKTTNSYDFLLASKKRLVDYDILCNYYNSDNWSSKLIFKTYIKKQKAVEEICKRLVVGSKKYGRGSKTGVKTATENTSIHYPYAPQDAENPPTRTVIAFGDATFYGNMRGNKAAPVKLIKKKLQQMRGDTIQICFIDEYLTSQVCNVCKNRALENVSTAKSKRRVHSVLKCNNNSCNIVWNRDINAAKNIFDIIMFAAHNNNRRPPAFERPEQAT
ncbi:hypothetical protein INT47_003809 [Mucor saturninus]|uniref:Cas12f1-like TNB domain-containing protein n=1 Tax=Mucor saturninus TaxID=64648 RepID=A0A8H7R9F9_9FUNG|nr:hypothetical protein INT47_003809 [Mucor saturninus]